MVPCAPPLGYVRCKVARPREVLSFAGCVVEMGPLDQEKANGAVLGVGTEGMSTGSDTRDEAGRETVWK